LFDNAARQIYFAISRSRTRHATGARRSDCMRENTLPQGNEQR
jgi:hypothetical protein